MRFLRKRTIIYVAVCLTVASALWIVQTLQSDAELVRKECSSWPQPVARANRSGWQSLREGMTKEQVIALLGDSDAKTKPEVFADPVGAEEGAMQFIYCEIWEYDWSSSPGSHVKPHPGWTPIAYVVQFDKDGKVKDWSKPQKEVSWLSWKLKRMSR